MPLHRRALFLRKQEHLRQLIQIADPVACLPAPVVPIAERCAGKEAAAKGIAAFADREAMNRTAVAAAHRNDLRSVQVNSEIADTGNFGGLSLSGVTRSGHAIVHRSEASAGPPGARPARCRSRAPTV